MANVKVTLIINCKAEKGWRRYPVALGKNGRARSGVALIKGEPVEFETFRYELRS